MFVNLIIEMKKKKVSQMDLAKLLGISQNSVCQKINGESDFKSEEMFAIRDTFFPNLTLEYLFKKG